MWSNDEINVKWNETKDVMNLIGDVTQWTMMSLKVNGWYLNLKRNYQNKWHILKWMISDGY